MEANAQGLKGMGITVGLWVTVLGGGGRCPRGVVVLMPLRFCEPLSNRFRMKNPSLWNPLMTSRRVGSDSTNVGGSVVRRSARAASAPVRELVESLSWDLAVLGTIPGLANHRDVLYVFYSDLYLDRHIGYQTSCSTTSDPAFQKIFCAKFNSCMNNMSHVESYVY